MTTLRVQSEDFDVGSEMRKLCAGKTTIGAVVSFVGLVRDVNEGGSVAGMTLEHYPGMTEAALSIIVEQAKGRWEILDCTVIHRVGNLKPADQIVLVIVACAHRGQAFEACEFIMDYLKTRAPLWKKEHTPEGERWVEAREGDDSAASRW